MEVTLPTFFLIILASIAVSFGGIFLVRKNIKGEHLKMHHDVTDPVLAVLGTLFAILLGFMLANSMQRFEEARTNVEQEAGAVGDIYRLVDGLPIAIRDKTRKDCLTYVRAVINDEWPVMRRGKFSQSAWTAIDAVWGDCLHYQPESQAQSNIHQLLVGSISRVGECRRTRFAELKYGLPNTLWIIVIFGGLATIGFTYFFSVASLRLQVAMTSVITTLIGLNIYMLAGYDAPFNGDIALTCDPFKTTEAVMVRINYETNKGAATNLQ